MSYDTYLWQFIYPWDQTFRPIFHFSNFNFSHIYQYKKKLSFAVYLTQIRPFIRLWLTTTPTLYSFVNLSFTTPHVPDRRELAGTRTFIVAAGIIRLLLDFQFTLMRTSKISKLLWKSVKKFCFIPLFAWLSPIKPYSMWLFV